MKHWIVVNKMECLTCEDHINKCQDDFRRVFVETENRVISFDYCSEDCKQQDSKRRGWTIEAMKERDDVVVEEVFTNKSSKGGEK